MSSFTETDIADLSPVDHVRSDQSAGAPLDASQRVADLMQVIETYNDVTVRLEKSHEVLTDQVDQLRSQLATANEALERSRRLAALGEMASGIAHEVRNPLGSIGLYAQMLTSDLSEQPEQCAIAEKIGMAVRGLDEVVGDVLTYAKPIALKQTIVNASDLFERALTMVASMLTDRIQIQRQWPALTTASTELAESLEVSCDPHWVVRALVNLIRNGLEAMADQPQGCLTLSCQREGDQVCWVVCDTGGGVAPEVMERMFNPFFTTRHTGTGLGLAMVHRIAEAHDGQIEIVNQMSSSTDDATGERLDKTLDDLSGTGTGAMFTLRLPVRNSSTSISRNSGL